MTRMERYYQRRASGLCGLCGRPAALGALCVHCEARNRQQSAERHSRYRAAGMCGQCGGQLQGQRFVNCMRCRMKLAQYRLKNRLKGASNATAR
jgi:hypothetical protein